MEYYYTPFRAEYKEMLNNEGENKCLLCDGDNLIKQQIKKKDGTIIENEHYIWIVNWFPRFEGHTMLVPKRHIIDPSDETYEEVCARKDLQNLAQKTLLKMNSGAGIEIFLQWGTGSVSSIKHIHWHIVPASPSDKFRASEKIGKFRALKEDEERVIMYPVKIEKVREDLLADISEHL